jgi:hypothetical protein
MSSPHGVALAVLMGLLIYPMRLRGHMVGSVPVQPHSESPMATALHTGIRTASARAGSFDLLCRPDQSRTS